MSLAALILAGIGFEIFYTKFIYDKPAAPIPPRPVTPGPISPNQPTPEEEAKAILGL